VFYDGDAIPAWQNRLVVGGLASQQVVIVTLARPGEPLPPTDADGATRYDADWFDDAYEATAHPTLRNELGRVRHVAQAPGGELYAITSNRDGRARDGFPRDGDDVLVRLAA
jgi:glucose/arabinose dehydrogenase